ncbi:MAG: hypothetical protein KAI24_14160, partial [Planctomycetes bacterium]|nr:hypothetical protein [Planctomycetota bacterium]
ETGERPPTGAPASPESDRRQLMDADRFASLLAVARQHLERGELGRAGEVVGELQAGVGGEPQLRQVQQLADQLARARTAAELEILSRLRRGEVLAADLEAERLVARGSWRPQRLLADHPGLQTDWQAAPAGDAGLPEPEPLPRKRRVRLQWQEGWQEGTVASARPERTTVHLRSGNQQSYPTVATVAIEPVGSTHDEAVEMGLAAVHASAPRLARLWLLRALLLSDQLSERGALLREALRRP